MRRRSSIRCRKCNYEFSRDELRISSAKRDVVWDYFVECPECHAKNKVPEGWLADGELETVFNEALR